jgi:Ni/Co efflux regulator RcnB
VKQKSVMAAVLVAGIGMGVSASTFAQGEPHGPGPGGPGGPQYRQDGPAPMGQPGQMAQPARQDQARPGVMVGQNGGGIQNPNFARQPGNGNPPPHNSNNNGYGNGHGDYGRPPMQANGGQHAYGPREWRRGDRIPNDYRNRQYVVDDYRGYGLSRPQRGYQWIGVNGDYALVAIATGLIAQIVVNGR